MPELVDKGYLYIAQPPLFKIGKGKSESYIKDENELNDFILKKICDKRQIKVGNSGKILKDHTLFIFLCDLSEYSSSMTKLENRGMASSIVEVLIRTDVQDKAFLQDRSKMENLKQALETNGYACDALGWNEDDGLYELVVNVTDENKYLKTMRIDRSLIYSSDYQKCLLLDKKLESNDQPPFEIGTNDNDDSPILMEDKRLLLKYLIDEGKKGINIQRYKGLGEMNPEQLWQTTMHPDKRNLLRVTVEDAVESDEIFTILMGDEVEPRRDFIQNNALEVSMLDI
jgi:DNA gyrase subunit B